MTGWRSVEHPDDYFRYDSPLRNSGERFEPGSPNVSGLLGLEAAMTLLLDTGLAEIEARIFELTDHLIAGLQAQGLHHHHTHRPSPRAVGHRLLSTAGCGPRRAGGRLAAAGVVVSQRGDVIRVSPHFYNNEEDLGRLLEVVGREC